MRDVIPPLLLLFSLAVGSYAFQVLPTSRSRVLEVGSFCPPSCMSKASNRPRLLSALSSGWDDEPDTLSITFKLKQAKKGLRTWIFFFLAGQEQCRIGNNDDDNLTVFCLDKDKIEVGGLALSFVGFGTGPETPKSLVMKSLKGDFKKEKSLAVDILADLRSIKSGGPETKPEDLIFILEDDGAIDNALYKLGVREIDGQSIQGGEEESSTTQVTETPKKERDLFVPVMVGIAFVGYFGIVAYDLLKSRFE